MQKKKFFPPPFLPNLLRFKGYPWYKTISCFKAALDVQLINVFIWRKNNVSFSRYLDFFIFVKFTDFKVSDAIVDGT